MLWIRIRFLQIRILEFFVNPDPDPGNKKKCQRQQQNFGRNFCLQPNRYFIFVFNQSSRYFNKQGTYMELLFGIIIKISENHEKFVEQVDFGAQFHFQDPDPDSE